MSKLHAGSRYALNTCPNRNATGTTARMRNRTRGLPNVAYACVRVRPCAGTATATAVMEIRTNTPAQERPTA